MALNNYDVRVKSPRHNNNRRKTEQEERYHEDRIYRTGKYGHCHDRRNVAKGIAAPEDIIGSARTETTVEKVKTKFNINTTTDNKIVAVQADILFLAVKPIFFPEVIDQIKDVVAEDTLIVSIAAGRTLDYLKEAFGRPELKLIRCMPNTPALVLEGCTGVCAEENVTEEDMEQVLALLRSFGIASVVPERLMDVVVGVGGSSPAYVFMFIEAMADEAVAAGMPRKQAYEFAAQSVLGSARMVLETGRHPGELKDMVCSPGGTTIQAVKVLEEKGMRAAVMDAMDACIEKSKSM